MRLSAGPLLLALALPAMGAAGDKLIDDKLAAKVDLVVRSKRVAVEGGDKYAWYRVQVLEVLKNQSKAELPNQLSVAAYSADPGVPDGESTLYLERYNTTNPGLWKIAGAKATTGVSHVTKEAPAPRACLQGHALRRVPMVVGLPGKEMLASLRTGEALLAGCIGNPDQPETAYVCEQCKQWKTATMLYWQPLPKEFGTERTQ